MIHAKNLQKQLPNGAWIVKDFNLLVPSKTITCLVGPSGCGKTTSLKMINQIIQPTHGTVMIDNVVNTDMPLVEWRRQIGYVVQKYGLFPHLNVQDNISILSKELKRSQTFINNRVAELLNFVGLDYKKYRGRYPKELSGGEQQRVSLARALMEDPKILLMDEPFSALDVVTKENLKEEFLKLHEKIKKTVLLVTHNLNEARHLGNEIALMNEGKIVQVGSYTDLQKNPASDFVKNFLNANSLKEEEK